MLLTANQIAKVKAYGAAVHRMALVTDRIKAHCESGAERDALWKLREDWRAARDELRTAEKEFENALGFAPGMSCGSSASC